MAEATATQRQRPVLAFVDCDIFSGKDEIAREQLLENVRRYRTQGVAPLWANWLRHRADLRFVCLVRELPEFNNFILDVVRSSGSRPRDKHNSLLWRTRRPRCAA